jgi:hypothetical protein
MKENHQGNLEIWKFETWEKIKALVSRPGQEALVVARTKP